MLIKRFQKTGAAVLAVIMMLSLVVIIFTVIDDTTASARVTQSQIDRLRGQKREYERQKREVQTKINTIEFERMEEITKKEVLDQRIMLTGLEIESTTKIIEEFSSLIRAKEYEVVLAQNREEEQLQRYRNRVREMEENGIVTYLEIIFESTSFSDLLARVDFVGDIMRADERIYNMLQDARSETIAAKEDLEITKAELDEEKIALELMEAELSEQIEEAQDLIKKLESDIETEKELHAKIAAEEERVQRQINAAVAEMQRQQELERQRLARMRNSSGNSGGGSGGAGSSSASMSVTGSGQLMWPVGGRVSSGFGMRNGRMHQGIDVLAPTGTSIVAADSGTVTVSAYSPSYGNYVVINHGNGITTLYAHMNSRSVSAGSSVSKGQLIGTVGSTGMSTAPHLHFEVSVNGSRVNPLTKL